MSRYRAAVMLAGLALGCAGAPDRSTTPDRVTVSGTLSAVDGGWTFDPAPGSGPSAPLVVPPDIAAVVQQIVAGEVTPGRATLEATRREGGWTLTGWRCIECRPPPAGTRWVIHGTEPFWSVVIGDDGARWRDPEAGTTTALSAREAPDDRWTLTAEDGSTATVRLEARTCDDGMADARWRYTAHVERDGMALRGCAMDGR